MRRSKIPEKWRMNYYVFLRIVKALKNRRIIPRFVHECTGKIISITDQSVVVRIPLNKFPFYLDKKIDRILVDGYISKKIGRFVHITEIRYPPTKKTGSGCFKLRKGHEKDYKLSSEYDIFSDEKSFVQKNQGLTFVL
jgi:hypothetical protein